MDDLAFSAVKLPDWLAQPKPRQQGLTCILDKGLPPAAVAELLRIAGRWIDVVKLGWGTARLTPQAVLREKLHLYRTHQVRVCTGGTLLEVAWLQGAALPLLEQAASLGFDCVEVSCGGTELPEREKHRLIGVACHLGLEPWSEVGKKDPGRDAQLSLQDRLDQVERDLQAGAARVILEGRESGTVGIYGSDGSPQQELLDRLVERFGTEVLVLEAPRKSQQVWLMRRFGSQVNLANVPPEEALPVATLRAGLRADTLQQHYGPGAVEQFRGPEFQVRQWLRHWSQPRVKVSDK